MPKIRVRARAVDMLGRQQIAGIPTAIHELFKNAHDAYAERAEVDYFRRTRVMVLRDDGYGMTKKDVEERWLTLGTESRIGANRPNNVGDWTGPKNLPRRTIMGEKGIGRLAIGVIAPVTLMMTRAVRPEGMHDLVVALVHWGIFEQPGLDISQIEVPVVEFPGGYLPQNEDIKALIWQIRNNIRDLKDDLGKDSYFSLMSDIDAVGNIDPEKIDATLRRFLKKDEEPLSLSGNGYGTQFILLPTAPELNDDIDGGWDKDASPLQRNLLGFSNTMTGRKPVIRTEFRDHNLDEYPSELIGPRNFFLPEEFDKSDHHFHGHFDDYGQFNGTVKIYGEDKLFICNWTEGAGRLTKCGPFSINFAYVMGSKNETRLSPEDFGQISEKLSRIGGLYIYRDCIRILPYGNSDIDFLDIEKRRTLSAGDWFFSYRRVFGFIEINYLQNDALNEKAGREGFRQNQAYKDFRAVLINFFKKLAFEFFRPTSPQSESYWDNKNALTAEAKLLDKQRKNAENRRKEFKNLLDKFFRSFEDGLFEKKAEEIRSFATARMDRLLQIDDDGELASQVRNLNSEISKGIGDLRNNISISKPRGLALSKKLEQDWAAYQRISGKVKNEIVEPLQSDISQIIRTGTADRISDKQLRDASIRILESRRDNLVKDLSGLKREAYAATEEMRHTLKKVLRQEFADLSQSLERLITEFTRSNVMQPEELEKARSFFENEIERIRNEEWSLLDALRRQMQEITEAIKARETVEDRTGALEQHVQRLEEQLDFYSDFAQMGMSVGILQHEFEKAAQNMRISMRDLKPWADGTPQLRTVYRRLRESFDHLDGYLKLLDPLGRRLYRTKVEISGDEIRLHLLRIYRRALDESGIVLDATDQFIKKKVKCRSSALLGAFINVVDNAVYWVSNGAKSEKIIRLDAEEDSFLISNSGPGIEERIQDRIFEFGETTKPGGRGMGLAISKDTLRREGFDIELAQAGSNVWPVFRILLNKNENDSEE